MKLYFAGETWDVRKNPARIRNHTAPVEIGAKVKANGPAGEHEKVLTSKHKANKRPSLLAIHLNLLQDLVVLCQELACGAKGDDRLDTRERIFGDGAALGVLFQKAGLDLLVAADDEVDQAQCKEDESQHDKRQLPGLGEGDRKGSEKHGEGLYHDAQAVRQCGLYRIALGSDGVGQASGGLGIILGDCAAENSVQALGKCQRSVSVPLSTSR